MYNNEIKRKFIFVLIVVLAISLTSLGIKLPLVTGITTSGKPKPRPRAIIKNQIKTCKQIIKQISPAAAVIGIKQIDNCPLTLLSSLTSLYCCYSFADVAQTLSRAPPLNSPD